MARALIVGCGCRGRALGAALVERGWQVRGTSRDSGRLEPIAAAGIEPSQADPDRPGTVLELVGDVTVVCWLLASARDEPEVIAAIHGPRLERLLERLVDTPVRGFVYEAAGPVQDHHLAHGRELVEAAAERWHIPHRLLTTDPADHTAWLTEAEAACTALAGRREQSSKLR